MASPWTPSNRRRTYSRESFTALRSQAEPLHPDVIKSLGAAGKPYNRNGNANNNRNQEAVFEPPKDLVPVDEAWLKPHAFLGDLTGSLEGGIEHTPIADMHMELEPASRGPPSPPPGFGPPPSTSSIPIPIPSSIPSSFHAASPPLNIAAIAKSRIARGPDLSRNFASRIEFTNNNNNIGHFTANGFSNRSANININAAAAPDMPPPASSASHIHTLFQSDNLAPSSAQPSPLNSLDSNHHAPITIPADNFNSNSTALLEQWFQDISVAEKKKNPSAPLPTQPPSPPLSADEKKDKEPEQLSSNVLSFFNSVKAQATKQKKVTPSAAKSIPSNSHKKSIPLSPSPSPPSRVHHHHQLPLPKQQQHTYPGIRHHHQQQPQRVVRQEPKIDHGLAGFPHLGTGPPNRSPIQPHPMHQQFRHPGDPSDLNTDPRRVGQQRPAAPPARFNVPNGNQLQPGNSSSAAQQQQHLFNLFANANSNANASNPMQRPQHLKNSAPQLQAPNHPMSQNANVPLNATMFAPPPQAIYLQQLQANAAAVQPSQQQQQQQQQRHQFASHMMPGNNNMPQVQPVRMVAHPQFVQAGGGPNAVPPGMMNKPVRHQQIPAPAVAAPHNPENVDSLQQWFHKLQQPQHHAPST